MGSSYEFQVTNNMGSSYEFVIYFLCPLETTHKRRPIAGGLLAPGEEASGQLLRLVSSFDSARKMNILQLFVEQGSHWTRMRF